MALVTTTLTPKVIYNPFVGITEQQRALSAIPRAEVYVTVDAAGAYNWPATGVGDARRLRIIHTLDTNYAYVIVSCHMKATTDAAWINADYAAELVVTASSDVYFSTALTSFESKIGSNPDQEVGKILIKNWFNLGNGENIRLLQLDKIPTGVIFPFNDTNSIPSVNLSWYDPVEQEPRVDIGYNLRLLQYDVDQAYNYMVNMPALVR